MVVDNDQGNNVENWGKNEIYNEKEENKENQACNQNKNKRETESDKNSEAENNKGNEIDNEIVTYTKNNQVDLVKKTDSKTTVMLNNKINDSDSTNSDNKDKNSDENKEESKIVTWSVTEENKEATITSVDPFEKHLTFPEEALKKKQTSRTKEKLPNAISSAAWRAYYNRKDDEKKVKIERANLKRKLQEERKEQNQRRPTKTSKKKVTISMKRNTEIQSSTSKDKVLCTLCEEELMSDTEEDENKNIGCDICPRWYHLKCTTMSDLKYYDAAQQYYIM